MNTAEFIRKHAKIEETGNGGLRLHVPDVVWNRDTGVEFQFLGPTTVEGIFAQFAGLMIEFNGRRRAQEQLAGRTQA
jgi:hypothetical protein